jgi:hypothetical protein
MRIRGDALAFAYSVAREVRGFTLIEPLTRHGVLIALFILSAPSR